MSTLIGPFAGLVELHRVSANVDAPAVKPASSLTLLSGRVRGQAAPRTSRSWTLRFPFFTAEHFGTIHALAKGVYGSPLFFYDPFTARANMLHEGVATPGLNDYWAECPGMTAGAALTVGGVPVPQTLSVGAATTLVGRTIGGTPDPVPCLPSTQYTASVHVSASATVGLRWIDAAGGTISTSTGSASSSRPTVTATAPSTAHGVIVVLTTTGTTRFTALQLNEGGLFGWLPGEGVPKVQLDAPDQNLVWATTSEQRRDLTVRMWEVG